MSKSIIFPNSAWKQFSPKTRTEYYDTHYVHIRNYLSYLGEIQLVDKNTTIEFEDHHNNFLVEIDGKKVMFDYSDFDYMIFNLDYLHPDIKYFKIHTTKTSDARSIAFPPMSFMDWSVYDRLKDEIAFNPYGEIFFKCRAYGGAKERREEVKEMLSLYKGAKVEFDFVPQEQFFESLSNCRINVIVPGARLDILDRTHMQSFAFGIPVITPKLTTVLPFGEMFEPNVDYIECAPDFSNLTDVLDTYKNNIEFLRTISSNCKAKFEKYCTPDKVALWIENNLMNKA